MADFDLVVLGAGPGGYVAAIRASQLGQEGRGGRVKYWGGVCLNVGCIPSKALLRNAELAHIITAGEGKFGIEGDATMAFGPTHARSRTVADGQRQGRPLPDEEEQDHEIDGWGTLTGADLDGRGAQRPATRAVVTFDNLIIATGATTRLIPGTSLSERVVTYEEQILTDQLPGSIIIAGSGAIGVEFAYVMKNFGVDVTIVEFLDRMVPTEDADVSKELLGSTRSSASRSCSRPRSSRSTTAATKVRVTVIPAEGRRAAGARGRQGAPGHRLRAAARGLRAGGARCR